MESQSQSHSSSSSSTLTNTNLKQPHFQAPLRSVRKVPAKPWKKPVAPPRPASPGIYNVEPKDFKDLVQKLTKGPGFQPRRLERVAPPPLSLSTAAVSDSERPAATTQGLLPSPYADTAPLEGVVLSPLVFTPSPTSRAWSSFFLPSPGNMSSWEQGTML